MTLPAVSISKSVFSISQAPASTTGILAILAASSTGTALVPGGYSRSDLAVDDFGYGPLVEYGAYDISVANQPFLAVKVEASYPGVCGAVTSNAGTGTSAVTAGASAPYDNYDAEITIVTGGIRGTSGIEYTYSLDGGNNVSGKQSLGTGTSITIPNSGVVFELGAGTLIAGATFQMYTQRPLLNDSDITDGLGVLGRTRLPYEGVLIDCSASDSTVGLIDTTLSAWEARGIFKFAIINSRYKTEPQPTGETEAAYAAALLTRFGSQTSIRQCVGADGAHVASSLTGYNQKRPTSMFLAARAMAIPIGEDPAYVARGPLNGAAIADGNGNPFDHDEDLYPNLDALRLTSLRSFAPGGPQGVYICNANTIQPTGGAFPYLQHIRILNRACEIAWFTLTTQLSRGIRKNPKKDPATGAITIFEPDAGVLDGIVQDALVQPMAGQVSDVKFRVSRTDDLSVVPAVITSVLEIVALAYVKGFLVKAQFVKTLTTPLT